ncbi:hypothetical protein Pint_17161 [Pistacia integerrima]|uniref:Uncharacterized protein n=1 Tax=Pistacia integerrima TaxID=434235 RepID=A0ACC0YXJ6_9ROSI|nr:hypothetical protein Pint_17161 [Pistacia integerrima]
MARETSRKCSHCGNIGHNSRTCNGKGCFKLFGVELSDQNQDQSIKKSASFGNLQSLFAEPHNSHGDGDGDGDDGYLSDGQVHCKRAKTARERKKGKPWNEDEHVNFLAGLKLLGKGDWKGISKKFVPTRTPTQVASHAQKYFLRQGLSDKKNRRASVFDIPYSESAPASPKDSLPPISEKPVAETSSQVNAPPSSIMPLKSTFEMPLQANNLSQIANQFPNLCLNAVPIALTSSNPNYSAFPYGLETPSNVQRFRGFQAMNYQRPGYVYMPPSAPVTTHHPSGIPPPPHSSQDAPRTFKRASTTSTTKDSLELKIGPPESPQRADLSSGAIQVV